MFLSENKKLKILLQKYIGRTEKINYDLNLETEVIRKFSVNCKVSTDVKEIQNC